MSEAESKSHQDVLPVEPAYGKHQSVMKIKSESYG